MCYASFRAKVRVHGCSGRFPQPRMPRPLLGRRTSEPKPGRPRDPRNGSGHTVSSKCSRHISMQTVGQPPPHCTSNFTGRIIKATSITVNAHNGGHDGARASADRTPGSRAVAGRPGARHGMTAAVVRPPPATGCPRTARLAPSLRRAAAATEFVLGSDRPHGSCGPAGGWAERSAGRRPGGGPTKKWHSANASPWWPYGTPAQQVL